MALNKFQRLVITASPNAAAGVATIVFVGLMSIPIIISSLRTEPSRHLMISLGILIVISGPVYFFIMRTVLMANKRRFARKLGRDVSSSELLALTDWLKGGSAPTDTALRPLLPRYIEFQTAVAKGENIFLGNKKWQTVYSIFFGLFAVFTFFMAFFDSDGIRIRSILNSIIIGFVAAISWPNSKSGNRVYMSLNRKMIRRLERMHAEIK